MTIKSLGFTGSSDQGMPTIKQIAGMTSVLHHVQPKSVHHGDCVSSDEAFHYLCQGLVPRPRIHIHPPDNDKKRAFCEQGRPDFMYPVKSYLDRNQDIVDASDGLLATPNGPEKLRSGTWSTVRLARKKGIPIYIVYQNGDIEWENLRT